MRKATLLYNPLSGRNRGRRVADVESAAAVLRASGVEVSVAPTRGAADATDQTKQAIAENCDAIFACGGDGTIHDILQGLAHTTTSLGIIPLGTANSLAHDLGLPLSPVNAARAALKARIQRITLGKVEYLNTTCQPEWRYFIVAAGVGVDAHLFYKLNGWAKRQLGMTSYYMKATHLWLTHQMEKFEVEPVEGNGTHAVVSELLAVRIRNFGNILRELAPGASLERDDLRLVMCKTFSRTAYLRYVARGMLGAKWNVGGIELMHSTSAVCRPSADGKRRVYVEADGEILGTLPARISVVPNALNILMP